ncbi:MAG: hypothetical protein V4568_01715 [Pseudomonadota bacterium]
MAKVSARPLNSKVSFPRGSEVNGLEYGLGRLSIRVQGAENATALVVEFIDTIGFRVLDERDLLEYWPECSTPNGGLFEVTGGGWLSQEANREGSLISAMNPEAKECLVAGGNDCVSVICRNEPAVYENAL